MRASSSSVGGALAGTVVAAGALLLSASALAEVPAPPPRPKNVLIADLGLRAPRWG